MVLTVLFLASCSPTRRAVTTNSTATRQVDGRITLEQESVGSGAATITTIDSLIIRQASSTKTELSSDEEITTTTREYDTTLPVDPATGTPPLMRETTQTRRRVDAGRQEQTATQDVDRRQEGTGQAIEQRVERTDMRGDFRTQANVAASVEAAEKRGLTTTQRVLCIIGALAILVGLVWLGRKLLKRYL